MCGKTVRALCLFAISLAVGCTARQTEGRVAGSKATSTPFKLAANHVVIGERIAFAGADKKPVVPTPGVYRVEASGSDKLKVFFGEAQKPFVLEARKRTLALKKEQQGRLKAPRAVLYRQEKSAARALLLFMPDGTVYESPGWLEGARTRGILLGDDTVERSSGPIYGIPVTKPWISIKKPTEGEVYWNRLAPLPVRYDSAGISSRPHVTLVHRISSRTVAFALGGTDLTGLYHLDPGLYDVFVREPFTGVYDTVSIRVVGCSRSLDACKFNNLALGPDTYTGKFNDYVWQWGQVGYTTHTGERIRTRTVDFRSTGFRAVAVAAGDSHSMALDSSGGVYVWGAWDYIAMLDNNLGEPPLTSPTAMPSPLAGHVVAIAAGHDFALALKDDGTVISWGQCKYGECGNGSRQQTSSQVQFFYFMPSPVLQYDQEYKDGILQYKVLKNVVAIAAGSEHALALKADGTIWGWGRNSSSQLDGTVKRNGWRLRAIPLQSGWVKDHQVRAIAATTTNSFALVEQADGGLQWYGWGWTGATSQTTPDPEYVEEPVEASESNSRAFGTGDRHTLTLYSGQPRSIYMRGNNDQSQLAIAAPLTYNRLTQADLAFDIIAVQGGLSHSLAMGWDPGGAVSARPVLLTWGANDLRQLGSSSSVAGGELNTLRFR